MLERFCRIIFISVCREKKYKNFDGGNSVLIFGFYKKLWPIVVLANRSHTGMGSPINTLGDLYRILLFGCLCLSCMYKVSSLKIILFFVLSVFLSWNWKRVVDIRNAVSLAITSNHHRLRNNDPFLKLNVGTYIMAKINCARMTIHSIII